MTSGAFTAAHLSLIPQLAGYLGMADMQAGMIEGVKDCLGIHVSPIARLAEAGLRQVINGQFVQHAAHQFLAAVQTCFEFGLVPARDFELSRAIPVRW